MTVLGTKYWDGLVFTAAALFGLFLAFQVLGLWAKHVYRNKWLGGDHASQLDVDAFVDNEVNREPPNHLKVVFMHKSATSGRTPIDNTIELSSVESDHVEGLRVTQRLDAREGSDRSHVSVTDGAKPLDLTATNSSATPLSPIEILQC